MIRSKQSDKSEGFTIVELLIATTVLSVILLLVSTMMVGIGRLYFKGINQARIQGNVRSITDEVTQNLQFNDFQQDAPVNKTYGTYTVKVEVYCIGSLRYTFTQNHQIGTSLSILKQQVPHVLWRDTISPGSCINKADLTLSNPSSAPGSGGSNGTELIAPNSRLTTLDISNNPATTGSPYDVAVGVAYGDSDLLAGSDLSTYCKSNAGDQFCATAALETTVERRL